MGCGSSVNIYNTMSDEEKHEVLITIVNKIREMNYPTLCFRQNVHQIYQSKLDSKWYVDPYKVNGSKISKIDNEYDFVLRTEGLVYLRIDSLKELETFLLKVCDLLHVKCVYERPSLDPSKNICVSRNILVEFPNEKNIERKIQY